jgi:hypothetical protein
MPRAAPGGHHDLTGQVPGSPRHGALLVNGISDYASNYWHNQSDLCPAADGSPA